MILQQGWDGKIASSRAQQFQKTYKLLEIKLINNREMYNYILIFIAENQKAARKIICAVSFSLPSLSVKNRGKKGKHYTSKYRINLKYAAHLTGSACIDSAYKQSCQLL